VIRGHDTKPGPRDNPLQHAGGGEAAPFRRQPPIAFGHLGEVQEIGCLHQREELVDGHREVGGQLVQPPPTAARL